MFIALRGYALVKSRALIMDHLRRAGWQVVIVTEDDEHSRELVRQGAVLCPVSFGHRPDKPGDEVAAMRGVFRAMNKHKPDLLHCFGAKPMIYGGWAARMHRRTRAVCTVTGLGSAFEAGGRIQKLSKWGFKTSLPRFKRVIFQNRDDMGMFLDHGWVRPDQALLIVGSGVDVDLFKPVPPPVSERHVVLLTARLLWAKGVREYVDAVEMICGDYPRIEFQLAGEVIEGRPDAVDQAYIDEVHRRGNVKFLGYLRNFPEVLGSARMFVAPSYYREGVPRVLLEASSAGVPVITADSPGCREAVVDGVTGLLVPPRKVEPLAQAIRKLLDDGGLCDRLGQQAREHALAEFDLRAITAKQVQVYIESGAPLEPYPSGLEATAPTGPAAVS